MDHVLCQLNHIHLFIDSLSGSWGGGAGSCKFLMDEIWLLGNSIVPRNFAKVGIAFQPL